MPSRAATGHIHPVAQYVLRSLGRGLRHASHRHRPIDRDAVHQAALRQFVIFDGQVLGAAVIPHEEIADAPLVAVEELRARDEVGPLVDERERLLSGEGRISLPAARRALAGRTPW